jgi:hypothetical protein
MELVGSTMLQRFCVEGLSSSPTRARLRDRAASYLFHLLLVPRRRGARSLLLYSSTIIGMDLFDYSRRILVYVEYHRQSIDINQMPCIPVYYDTGRKYRCSMCDMMRFFPPNHSIRSVDRRPSTWRRATAGGTRPLH